MWDIMVIYVIIYDLYIFVKYKISLFDIYLYVI